MLKCTAGAPDDPRLNSGKVSRSEYSIMKVSFRFIGLFGDWCLPFRKIILLCCVQVQTDISIVAYNKAIFITSKFVDKLL